MLAAEITKAIGEEELAQFADALGKDAAVLAEYLAGKLPEAVDAATSGESAAAEKRSRIGASDTLLVIFDGLPDQVTIREPAQGISLGLDTSS